MAHHVGDGERGRARYAGQAVDEHVAVRLAALLDEGVGELEEGQHARRVAVVDRYAQEVGLVDERRSRTRHAHVQDARYVQLLNKIRKKNNTNEYI